MRWSRAPLAALTTIALSGLVVLGSGGAAQAETRSFPDRYNDVRTGNDIRSVRVTVDFDLWVTVRMKDIVRGKMVIWIDTDSWVQGGDYEPELVYVGRIKGDWTPRLYRTDGRWRAEGPPLDCGVDATVSRSRKNVEVYFPGECAPEPPMLRTARRDEGGVRVSVYTAASDGHGGYRGDDYAPRYHWYLPSVSGEPV